MQRTAFIGFGEAGRAFAGAAGWRGDARAFDLKLLGATTRPAIERAVAEAGIDLAESTAQVVAGADLVISVVTADQALAAARATAPHLLPGALFCDCNSVAPDTKRAAARAVEAVGARYVDVAVMAPVLPARLGAPLLLAGAYAEDATTALRTLGFGNVRALGGEVGSASAVKMIRSVMVKGVEALTAECFLAAEAAGVRQEVTASLDASWPGVDWARKADYNFDRMLVHGLRRAEELAEVVKTLEALGTGSTMSRGTAEWQHAMGGLMATPPPGLDAKLRALLPHIVLPNRHRDAA